MEYIIETFKNMKGVGQAYVEPDDVEEIMDFISTTFEEMEDVTDEYMTEYGR